MHRITYLLGLIFILFMGIAACEGPSGPEGPQGPQGPEGPQGQQGPQGPQGNANVTIISVPEDSITWESGDYLGRTSNVDTVKTDSLDQDIIDHGMVLGYFNLFGENWYQMPFTWENSDGSSRQYIVNTYSLNTITLYAYQTGGVLTPGVTEYRFLLITDKTVKSKAAGKTGTSFEDLDTSNYYEVMDYFGLEN